MHWVIANPGSIPELLRLAEHLDSSGDRVTYITPLGWTARAGEQGPGARMLGKGIREGLRRRTPALTRPGQRVRRRATALELGYLLARRLGLTSLREVLLSRRNVAFDRAVSRCLNQDVDALVVRSTACIRSLRRARALGVLTVLDAPIMHQRSLSDLLAREAAAFPSLSDSLVDLKAEAVAESLDRELDQADIIIALSNAHAHSFVENGVDSTRLLLAPLGVDTELFAFRPRPSRVAEHPPQVLFVGQITQRKGLAYLINAMDLVRQAQPDVILKLVGSAHGDILSQLPPYVVWHDAVAREHLAAHYHQADVFAFLSLAEGFAQTPLEAMACGLPVVMSRQAYGPDGPVRDGVEGFVLDARDVGGVAAKIVQLLADEATRQGMGAAAASRAREFTWERFAGKVRRDVLTVLAKRRSTSHGTR